jgi:hypothetical protein
MSKEYSIYEFWNKLPGPGEFERDTFAKIPADAPLWEGLRIGVTEYLGERWVVEPADKDNVVVRRIDMGRVFRLKQTFKDKTGELHYAMWSYFDVPPDKTFDYIVGAGTFRRAIERDVGIPVGYSAKLGKEEGEMSDGHIMTAVSLGDAPNAQQAGLVARWFIWSILVLQWVDESIVANPNP